MNSRTEGPESPNRVILEAMAERIRPLLPEVVFVGGQVAELYITDPAAVRVRVTVDVDVVVSAASRAEYRRVEERLRDLGFRNDTSDGAPVCRWVSPEGHLLDLMPMDEEILGFSNPWYRLAVRESNDFRLRDDLTIAIPRPTVFLATKLAAFGSRGEDDLLGSHDLEDVIAVVAGRPEIEAEIEGERPELRAWVSEQIREISLHDDFSYALQGALPDAALMPAYRSEVQARFRVIGGMD